MATTIYYFSATGNSLAAARALQDNLGDCELVQIADLPVEGPIDARAERIGIVFPVHAWGPPIPVTSFLHRLRLPSGCYAFALATMAEAGGEALLRVDRILRAAGGGLGAGFFLKMPSNFTPVFSVPGAEKQQQLFDEAKTRLKQIAGAIDEKRVQPVEAPHVLFQWIARVAYRLSTWGFPWAGRFFSCSQACTGCGLCSRLCPVRNIEITGNRPVWKKRCVQCMACLHGCPEQAIALGPLSRRHGQYRHPQVTVQDLMPAGNVVDRSAAAN